MTVCFLQLLQYVREICKTRNQFVHWRTDHRGVRGGKVTQGDLTRFKAVCKGLQRLLREEEQPKREIGFGRAERRSARV